MHIYKKHFNIDDSFNIKEYRTDGRTRIVGEDNIGYLAFIEDNELEEVAYVASATAREVALNRTIFKKQEIRRAMRSMGLEAELNAMLESNIMFKNDWLDSESIDLSDDITLMALEASELAVDNIKLKIGGIND